MVDEKALRQFNSLLLIARDLRDYADDVKRVATLLQDECTSPRPSWIRKRMGDLQAQAKRLEALISDSVEAPPPGTAGG